jgi:predicted nucleic-acid-binding protein
LIGLDANVLVRYLTDDDPVQSPRAIRFLEEELSQDAPGFVAAVVLTEVVWVLRRRYKQSRSEIAATVQELLGIDRLVLEHPQAVAGAVLAMMQDNVDFTDALIAGIGAGAGCSHTATFDRRASRLPGFVLL